MPEPSLGGGVAGLEVGLQTTCEVSLAPLGLGLCLLSVSAWTDSVFLIKTQPTMTS